MKQEKKLKERMKEHKDDGEKSRKDKKITGLSQHMKTTGHSPAWDDVRIIYTENNWKKRNFKEAARITSHNKEQLMNKKDERKTISNLWNIVLKELRNCISRIIRVRLLFCSILVYTSLYFLLILLEN